jgi:hypothetical protein
MRHSRVGGWWVEPGLVGDAVQQVAAGEVVFVLLRRRIDGAGILLLQHPSPLPLDDAREMVLEVNDVEEEGHPRVEAQADQLDGVEVGYQRTAHAEDCACSTHQACQGEECREEHRWEEPTHIDRLSTMNIRARLVGSIFFTYPAWTHNQMRPKIPVNQASTSTSAQCRLGGMGELPGAGPAPAPQGAACGAPYAGG